MGIFGLLFRRHCGKVYVCDHHMQSGKGGEDRRRERVLKRITVVKRQHCDCPTWSTVDEVEVYRGIRRVPPGSRITAAERRDKTSE